jgi:hypothetical protein
LNHYLASLEHVTILKSFAEPFADAVYLTILDPC